MSDERPDYREWLSSYTTPEKCGCPRCLAFLEQERKIGEDRFDGFRVTEAPQEEGLSSVDTLTNGQVTIETAGGQPIEVNETGGMQSKVPYALNLIPPKVLLAVAKELKDAALRYEPAVLSTLRGENWRLISVAEHYNHAIGHLLLWHNGDRSEPHILHAICRLMFIEELS